MYNVKTHKFHDLHVCKGYTYENSIGPFNRFEKEQLQKLVDIINKQNQTLEPIQEICKKYRIPIDDLPETLEEYISRDNE